MMIGPLHFDEPLNLPKVVCDTALAFNYFMYYNEKFKKFRPAVKSSLVGWCLLIFSYRYIYWRKIVQTVYSRMYSYFYLLITNSFCTIFFIIILFFIYFSGYIVHELIFFIWLLEIIIKTHIFEVNSKQIYL